MKLLVFAVAIAVCAAAVVKEPSVGYKDGDRYFYFPGDGDDQVHLVDAFEPVDQAFLNNYFRNANDNGYWLFTRNNPTNEQVLINGDANSVSRSNFNPSRTTVFIAHGWNGSGRNDMSRSLTEAFLQNADVNVIVLDWSRLANRGYTTAKAGVADVGRGLGRFINWLTTRGLNLDRVHLVGFSLGGHLVGNAGREVGGRVKRITALDPAGPLWGNDNNRIVRSDGRFVEIMHTNTGLYGYTDPCGDLDHYPNGGSSMPGCWVASCSHSRAWEYMASTVKTNHLHGNRCDSYRDATRNRCTGGLLPMGNSDINKSGSGIYRVNTANRYPF